MITCWECGKEIDEMEYSTSYCSTCKGQFCCGLSHTCFTSFHKKAKCEGACLCITNPEWIINLRNLLEQEKWNGKA